VGYEGEVPKPAVTDPEPLWTGKQAFSLFLPKDFSFVTRANICMHCAECKNEKCEHDAYVLIQNGNLVTGIIDKNSIGAERPDTIFHRVIKDYGTDAGHDFLNGVSRLINGFLTINGFTYSYDELALQEKEIKSISKVMRTMEKSVAKLTGEFQTGVTSCSRVCQ